MQPEEPESSQAPSETPRHVSRWAIFRSVGGAVVSIAVIGGLLALFHPETPLPDAWNATAPLSVADPVSPLTSWKLRIAIGDPAQCLAALRPATNAAVQPALEATENCHIRNRVTLSSLSRAEMGTVDTACATALRLAMWERHGVQPAAREILGSEVSRIRQIGSYNCRPMRTSQGNSTRWSTHSTADAIDVTGFDFSNGRRIRLIDDWQGDTPEAAFLRAVRDSACTWFATTLSPDYNNLHADHFHLQSSGWGTCR